MGRLIYSNIIAPKIHYPLVDYILNIKEFYEEDDLLVLCFWDFEVYNFKTFKNKPGESNLRNVREIVGEISRLLSSLKIRHKIIYLSDAIKRIHNDPILSELLFFCYTSIKMGNIQDIYKNNKYLKLRPTSLGKLNFMVMDYIVALFFNKLYPNISKGESIDIYHTGERFLGIKNSLEEAISKGEIVVNFPSIKYWKTIPILNHNEGNWISASTSYNEILKILSQELTLDSSVIKDLISIGFKLKDATLNYKIEKLMKKVENEDLPKEILVSEVADILSLYFYNVKKLIQKSDENEEVKKVNYVSSKKDFENFFKYISSAKMEILKYCNGKNTVDEIIKLMPMRESSVRSYISRMKKEKLISDSKKPHRLIDEIVINFE